MTFVCRKIAHNAIRVLREGGNLHCVGFFDLCWFEYCAVRVLWYLTLKMLLQRYTHYMHMTSSSCYPTASVRLGMGHCFVKLGKMDKAR